MFPLQASFWACLIPYVAAAPFSIANFNGLLADDTGTLRSLVSGLDASFDFSPSDYFDQRNGPSQYHLGDVNLRYRAGDSDQWIDASTAESRGIPLVNSPEDPSYILQSDLSTLLRNTGLTVIRTWSQQDGDLTLSFTISNAATTPIEIGALGFPMEFNNILTGRSPEDARRVCSFVEPYIGMDAGYLQVTRVNGAGPNLVVTPYINGTKLEAWTFLEEALGDPLQYQTAAYEGNYAWQVYSKGLYDNDWADVQPWNDPTSITLQPGESAEYGFRFTVVAQVYDIETTVANVGHPVVMGFPGYILAREMVGSLYVYGDKKPTGVTVSPKNALVLGNVAQAPAAPWKGYTVTPADDAFGRVRVELAYPDGTVQTVHYWITDTAAATVDKVGKFGSEKTWFTDTEDPFHRAPSFLSFDKSTDDYVLQEPRTFIAGLSDEGGAGAYLTFAVKQILQPVPDQVAQLEEFVNTTVWGQLQVSEGETQYGVRKSLFYYDPALVPGYPYDEKLDWSQAWDISEAYRIDRAYNYVHVSVAYYALYKAERISPGILTVNDASWYLLQAYKTAAYALGTNAQGEDNTQFSQTGLVGEWIWVDFLNDLRGEGNNAEADDLEKLVKKRQTYWASQEDPYGSEQPWDCTGQEGVYAWSVYFNDTTTAQKTVESIHGYDPTVPHWGYNGNARRYWDFGVAGAPATSRIERQIHHYGSAFNALPLLDNYRRSPDPSAGAALRDLRVGYGGHMASLTNIDIDGFFSMAFHSFADTLAWDSYTADYGPNFLGHALGAACYLVAIPDLGWHAFGGNVKLHQNDDDEIGAVTVMPLDSARRRIYVAPLGLYVTFEAGQISEFVWKTAEGVLSIDIGSSTSPSVLMTFAQTSAVLEEGAVKLATKGLKQERGAYVVEIPEGGTATVEFSVK